MSACNPKIMLSWSNDGGKTWSNEVTVSMGKLGEYQQRVNFYRCGMGRQRVWSVRFTDPCEFMINGASILVTPGIN